MSVIFTVSDIFTGTSTIFSCCSYGSVFESNMIFWDWGPGNGIFSLEQSKIMFLDL